MVWWRDIDIEFNKKNNGDINDYIDVDAIIQSLRNIFLTMRGQRRRLPTFALNIYELLFDPVDDITAREIGEIMLEVVQVWETRVIIEDLLVRPNSDKNLYDISLTFKIRDFKTPESITIEETIQAS